MRRALAIASTWLAVGATSAGAQSQAPSEYEVKAAFLYNFAKFIEWPADGSWKDDDPLTICVVGGDSFGEILDDTVRGKSIARHGMAIRRLKPGRSWKGCQIAFISSSQKEELPSILANSAPADVLTVGETKGFAERGGMINLVVEQDRVRFEVNVDAAERAGFKISSKLLNLATIIRTQDPKGKG